jgi:hypothetical protein
MALKARSERLEEAARTIRAMRVRGVRRRKPSQALHYRHIRAIISSMCDY